jgi:hypothetical protein
MRQLELNIIESFRRAKSDIIRVEQQIIDLRRKQDELFNIILEAKDKEGKLSQKVTSLKSGKTTKVVKKVKVIGKAAPKHYVASKEGKKFHILECPFAKNIKPKSKVNFKSKTKALNDGYKPCSCVVK